MFSPFPTQTLKAFLPSMLTQNHGHVVTVASSAGIFGVNGMLDYCASKFAAVGLHESLTMELYAQGKDGVNTTLVCPYLVHTGMFKGAGGRYDYAKRGHVDLFCVMAAVYHRVKYRCHGVFFITAHSSLTELLPPLSKATLVMTCCILDCQLLVMRSSPRHLHNEGALKTKQKCS